MFTYCSICSGIEAVSVAWKDFATPAWFAEIEEFPSAVLDHHYPKIKNHGDMTTLAKKILNREITAPDVLVGGTPCQAFSVAGQRNSLDDARGNLTLQLINILEAIDYVRHQNGQPPCVLVWENVPGVLSTKDNAFGHFLAGLVQECEQLQSPGGRWSNAGYVHSARTVTWRVLNAQYFGVAQRRKRVFLVASARRRSTAQILIEQKGVRGDFAQSKSTKQNTTTAINAGVSLASGKEITGPLLANCGEKQWLGNQEAFSGDYFVVHGSQDPIVNNKTAHCLGRNNGLENILFEVKGAKAVRVANNNITPTLKARMGTCGNNIPCIASPPATIRKLTPMECERLQGFPDNYTKIPYRNKSAELCPDSPRYKALGNSMAVPVMKWIGLRVLEYFKNQ